MREENASGRSIPACQEGEWDMLYRTCEYCGAHLDPGEHCDCREEGAATDDIYRTKKEEEADVIGEEH